MHARRRGAQNATLLRMSLAKAYVILSSYSCVKGASEVLYVLISFLRSKGPKNYFTLENFFCNQPSKGVEYLYNGFWGTQTWLISCLD